MKAAVVTDFTQPLEIQDRPVPEPGPGQVLVRIETCGLCHTDIHAAHGDWPVKPTPPFVPGHEGVGIVERVGADVTVRQVGDRVAIAWLGHACGRCDHCISGWETLCEQQQNSGYGIDGAFAEYAVADADFVVPVPEGVSSLRRRPTHLRRRHDLQGDQGGAHPARGEGGHLRRRRARPPSGPVRATGRRRRRRCRRRRHEARAGAVTGGRPHRERRDQPTRSPHSKNWVESTWRL